MKSDKSSGNESRPMKCEDIQVVLLDYMSRELGDARSNLVREHLRKCEDCQAVAGEIQATLDLLRSTSKAEPDLPAHLSEKRRARILRAYTHPILDWIYTHHIIFSIIVTLAAAIVIACVVRKVKLLKAERIEQTITITIGLSGEVMTNSSGDAQTQEPEREP